MIRVGSTGDWIGTFIGHKGAVWGCSLNPDATIAATASADFTAKLWNALTGDETASLSHKHIVRSIDISRDSRKLLTASKNNLYIYDMNNLEGAPSELTGHDGAVKKVLFSPEGNFALSAAEDNTVRMWETTSGMEIAKASLPENPSTMQLSQDGTVLTVCSGKQIYFYAVPSLTIIKNFDANCPVYSACLSPDKQSLVFGGEDFKVYRWNYDTGTEVANYRGHFGPVHCVRFSPDGELYASGSEDGTLRLWQTNLGKTYGLWKVESSLEE
jgi:serine-threonine kinase receptor-associated protein